MLQKDLRLEKMGVDRPPETCIRPFFASFLLLAVKKSLPTTTIFRWAGSPTKKKGMEIERRRECLF